jgi:hypothetical protein
VRAVVPRRRRRVKASMAPVGAHRFHGLDDLFEHPLVEDRPEQRLRRDHIVRDVAALRDSRHQNLDAAVRPEDHPRVHRPHPQLRSSHDSSLAMVLARGSDMSP